MNAIFKRVSVRQFEEKAIESEKIEKILQAGFSAPSALNERPWEFYVVTNKDKLNELSKSSPYAKTVTNAPAVIVICYNTSTLKNLDFVDINCSVAAENMLIEMEELGLGGVFMALRPFDERVNAVAKILNTPKEVVPFNLMPFGYPKNKRQAKLMYNAERVHYVE